jgi:cation/acetate symporter
MIFNFVVSFVVMSVTPPPPQEVQDLIENIRVPK